MPSGVSPCMTVSRSARLPWLTPIRMAMSPLLADRDDRPQRLLNGRPLLADLRLGVLVGPPARLAEDEQAGVDADLVHEPGDGDGDVAALVVDVGDERHAIAAPPHFRLDLAQAVRLGEGGGGDADDLAAGLVHGDDLLDAARDVAGLLGDHALHDDGVAAADDDGADAHGAGGAARITQFGQG